MKRTRVAAISACLLVGSFGGTSTSLALAPSPATYYVALGDSLAYGVTADNVTPDPQCTSPDAPGYVCRFYRYLRRINPSLQVKNFSDPGADSCEFLDAHHCYDQAARSSPLVAAISFLKAHPGEASPITLNIGANDLLALLPQALQDPLGTVAELPSVFTRYQENLDSILSQLRAVAPDSEIILSTQYNPLGGIGSPPLPPGIPEIAQSAMDRLNQIMVQEAPKYHVRIVDVAAAFAAHAGGAFALTYVSAATAAANFNPHPRPEGYKIWADVLIAGSGYLLPLKVSAHLTKKRVKAGKRETVVGKTARGAAVTITIRHPHARSSSVVTVAGKTGAFTKSFKVGRKTGTETVGVCVSNGSGQTACAAKLKFSVH